MRSSSPIARQGRRGAVAVQATLCLTALCSVMALALDGGVLMSERRHAQAVSEAAALSAAVTLYQNRGQITTSTPDPGKAANASALAVASANGYSNDGTTSVVTVNIPPKSGNFVGQLDYVEVIAQYNQPRFFSAVFGAGSIPITARSVARWKMVSLGISLLVMKGYPGYGSSTSGAVALSGTSTITLAGSVIVNSTSSGAAMGSGSAAVVASLVNISGTILTSGSSKFYAPSQGSQANVNQNVTPQTPDPLASLPEPDPSTLTVQSSSSYTLSGSASATLNPGVYKGGITLSGSASLALNPGIYYLAGGGLTLSGFSKVSGTGVLIYNGKPIGSNNPSQVGSIALSGTAVTQLTPMSSGTWQGIATFQDRQATASLALSGATGTLVQGMIYAPMAATTMSGGSNIIPGESYITNTMSMSGTSNFTIPHPSIPVANPSISLVE